MVLDQWAICCAMTTDARPPETVALLALGAWLGERAYRFTSVTPATQARINARAGSARARDLRDIFGWSRPFAPALLDPQALQWLRDAELRDPTSDGLLQGEWAEMFGVFSAYELQVIHDWIRGPASADGQLYKDGGAAADGKHRRSFRVAERLARSVAAGRTPDGLKDSELQDSDLDLFKQRLENPENAQDFLLVDAMARARHWTPAGLYATRLFCANR
jgi:hypothetical protein